MAGGQSWGSRHLSMSGSSARAVGQNTCLWPASWFWFPHSMLLDSSMNVSKIPGRGWVAFYDLPPEFHRDSSDAQITGLYRFEEGEPVSCFNKNMLKSCGHLGKYTDFLYHFMKYVLIFLGYINIPLNGSCEYFLSVLGSDLHSSFILWGINSAAVNNIIVISYVFQVFL